MQDGIRRQTATRRQVRTAALRLDAHPDGTYVLTCPSARGWQAVIRTNRDAGDALHDALVEAQLAAYARAHGQVYDHDAMTDVDPDDPRTQTATSGSRHLKGTRVSPGWEEQEDGTWRSPKGRVYGPETQVVQRVLSARRRAEAMGQQGDPPTE